MAIMSNLSALCWTLSFVVTTSSSYVEDSTPDTLTRAYVFTDGSRAAMIGVNLLFNSSNDSGRNIADNVITCLLYENTMDLSDTVHGNVRVVHRTDMEMLLEICQHNMADNQSSRRHKRFILPGTKWCGLGNVASDYNELGSDEQTDRCCRTHDHCPDHIAPFQTKNGITNFSILYRFNCECEDVFYNCLKEVNNEGAASVVGRLYFNLVQPTCFRIDHPTKCQRKGWWFLCKKKVLDPSQPKGWGFYEVGKSF